MSRMDPLEKNYIQNFDISFNYLHSFEEEYIKIYQ